MKRSDQYWGKEMTAGPRDCGGGCSYGRQEDYSILAIFTAVGWGAAAIVLFCYCLAPPSTSVVTRIRETPPTHTPPVQAQLHATAGVVMGVHPF